MYCDKIKPIETKYKGILFRSRLEAQWAYFFDEVRIENIYEPEGYDLKGDIGYYLPDFYLPKFKTFVEIKPFYSDDWYNTTREFNRQVNPIFLFCGQPWDYRGIWWGWETADYGGGETVFNAMIMTDYAILQYDIRSKFVYMDSDFTTETPESIISYEDLIIRSDLNPYNTDWDKCKRLIYKYCEKATNTVKLERFHIDPYNFNYALNNLDLHAEPSPSAKSTLATFGI